MVFIPLILFKELIHFIFIFVLWILSPTSENNIFYFCFGCEVGNVKFVNKFQKTPRWTITMNLPYRTGEGFPDTNRGKL